MPAIPADAQREWLIKDNFLCLLRQKLEESNSDKRCEAQY
jgi:hypothetical protein